MEKKALRLGASSFAVGVPDRSAFCAYAQAGIGTMEVSVPADKYDDIDWNKLQEYAKEFGIELWSMHLPFQPFETIDISSGDCDVRRYTLEYLTGLIKKACSIGIGTIVIHPSGEPIAEEERAERIKYAKDSLSALAEAADKGGAVIAVENLPRTCLGRNSNEIEELISADERLRVCFDTNHLLGEPIDYFVRKLGQNIATTHFSDFDYKNERHWLPGEGLIDWEKLMLQLKETGYRGPIVYEISLVTPPTIDRRPITLSDFADNYSVLMSGKSPYPVGKPIEELCLHWKNI